MKRLVSPVMLLALIQFPGPHTFQKPANNTFIPAGNLFIITVDGFRWQEVFTGADSILINDEAYTPDTAITKMLYWDGSTEERRKKLMPFFWNVMSKKGQLFGNRLFDNKVNVANDYAISYPGYNEMFTGNTDPWVSSNGKYVNPNINILEYLDAKPGFKGKIAAFTSWDVFPFILNAERNDVFINSGYQDLTGRDPSRMEALFNSVQDEVVNDKTATRYDQLTFLAAKEYIKKNQPRLLYLGLGETDEFAHQGRYDLYLNQANQVDKMIAELWQWVQTTAGYKDNTTFIITTDHGRGKKPGKWTSHGSYIKGSSETWLAIIGPGIHPSGEIRDEGQLYQVQIAQTIAGLMGEEFISKHNPAPAISLR
jgi:arylsulfatase A-like enzyme